MSLAPWDWLQYFGVPVETLILGTGLVQEIAPADPMRVILMFGNGNTSAPFNVSTLQSVTSSKGFALTGNAPPLIFTQSLHGPLTTLQWFGIGSNISAINVIKVSMTAWPKERMDAYNVPPTVSDTMERANQRIRQYISAGQR